MRYRFCQSPARNGDRNISVGIARCHAYGFDSVRRNCLFVEMVAPAAARLESRNCHDSFRPSFGAQGTVVGHKFRRRLSLRACLLRGQTRNRWVLAVSELGRDASHRAPRNSGMARREIPFYSDDPFADVVDRRLHIPEVVMGKRQHDRTALVRFFERQPDVFIGGHADAAPNVQASSDPSAAVSFNLVIVVIRMIRAPALGARREVSNRPAGKSFWPHSLRPWIDWRNRRE